MSTPGQQRTDPRLSGAPSNLDLLASLSHNRRGSSPMEEPLSPSESSARPEATSGN